MAVAEEQLDHRILSQRSARTLYNAADAWGIESPDRIEGLGPAVTKRLRHEGVGAARRTWAALAWIEWRGIATAPRGRGFSRRTREQRREFLDRSGRGWAVAWVRALIREAVGELDG